MLPSAYSVGPLYFQCQTINCSNVPFSCCNTVFIKNLILCAEGLTIGFSIEYVISLCLRLNASSLFFVMFFEGVT